MNCEALQTFRQEAHRLLTKAKDATFELMDAVMTTRHASSMAEFSLSPIGNLLLSIYRQDALLSLCFHF